MSPHSLIGIDRGRNIDVTLARASGRARDLANILVLARIDAVALGGSTHSLARDIEGAIARANALARATDYSFTNPLVSDHALARARDLANVLVSNLESARARIYTLNTNAFHAADSTLASSLATFFDGTYGAHTNHDVTIKVGNLDRNLVRARTRARSLARAIERTSITAAQGQRRAGPAAGSAVRLLSAAVWLVPAADRARYDEEYRSELWEIAQAGEPWSQQLRYACRQIMASLRLRGALQPPRASKELP